MMPDQETFARRQVNRLEAALIESDGRGVKINGCFASHDDLQRQLIWWQSRVAEEQAEGKPCQ